MLRLVTVDPGPSVETGAAAALTSLPVAQASELLYALEGAHLLACDASGQRWGMHDLVRAYGRELLEAAEDRHEQARARERLLGYYRTTALAASNHLKAVPVPDVPAQFSGRAQALEWYDANRANLVTAVALAVHHQSPDDAASLALNLTDYYAWRLYLEDWSATQELVREAVRPIRDREIEGAPHLTILRYYLAEQLRDRDAEGAPNPTILRYDLAEQRFHRAMHAQRRAAGIHGQAGGQDRRNDDSLDWDDEWGTVELADLDPVLTGRRGLEEAVDTLKRAAAVQGELCDRYHKGLVLGSVGLRRRAGC
jgi:hypothetical protein